MKTRKITADKRFLLLPVKGNGGWIRTTDHLQYFSLWLDGIKREEYELTLSRTPDFWACLYLDRYADREVELRLESGDESLLDLVEISDRMKDADALYREPDRPLYHMTPMHGFMNDPNGLVYYNGVYHCFAQLNPYGFGVGNTHWMHTVSRDLFHWEELPYVLLPDETGRMYSGGGVVDHNNTSGLQTGGDPPIVLFYTLAGSKTRWSMGRPFEIGMAYSTDGGKTFTKYAGNPVIPNISFMCRDPKALWDPVGEEWVLAVFLDNDRYQLFYSKDLLHWDKGQVLRLYGAAECPDLFRLPLDGDKDNMKWVLWGSTDNYIVGDIQDRIFIPETEVVEGPSHQGFSAYRTNARSTGGYAAQTFTNAPDGRVIQLAWLRARPAAAPFVSCMSLPNEFWLISTEKGPRLTLLPIEEVKSLYQKDYIVKGRGLEEFERIPMDAGSECMDVSLRMTLNGESLIAFSVRGVLIAYDPRLSRLLLPTGAFYTPPVDGCLELRIVTDKLSMEIYANGGRFNTSLNMVLDPAKTQILPVYLDPGIGIDLEIHNLKSDC